MKLITTTLILLFSCLNLQAAQKIQIEITGSEYSDSFVSEDFEQVSSRWQRQTNEWGDTLYSFNQILGHQDLPFKICLIGGCVSLSKKGEMSMGGYFGDYDVASEMEATLPLNEHGEFIKGVEPYHFHLTGGEHASGLWNLELNLKITILN